MSTQEPISDPGVPTPENTKPWYKKKRIIIPLALFAFIAITSSSEESATETGSMASSSTETDQSDTTSDQSASNHEEEEIAPIGEFGRYPEDQSRFVQIIERAKEAIDNAETDLQKNVALRERDKELCSTLSGNKVKGWSGVVKNVGATGEGKAYVDIEIADRIRVQTWNNALSDILDETLIPTSSPFFDNLVALNEGDLVTFSATFLKGNTCLKRGNLTEVFYGISPEFIVRFSDVKKY